MDSVDKNWSWIVLFGAFLANLLAGGTVFSFAILYTDFLDRLETGALETAVIGAIAFACCCFPAPFSRALASKLGYRFVTVMGSVIAFLGLLLGCFAPTIHYYYVFFGLLVGCGFSMVSVASFMAVEDYFQQGGTIALTLASCGFPTGIFLLPLITRALLDTYSYFGTFMILSALMLNGVVCGLLFKPLVKNVLLDRDKRTYKQMISPPEKEVGTDLETAYQSSSSDNKEAAADDEGKPDDEKMKLSGQRSPRYKTIERPEETMVIPLSEPIRFDDFSIEDESEEESSVDDEASPREKVEEKVTTTEEPSAVPREPEVTAQPEEVVKESRENGRTLLNIIIGVNDGKMLCDARIILYLLASILFSIGLGIPLCFFTDVSREYGYSNSKAEWALSLLGLGSCVGVVICGFIRRVLADRLECSSTLLVCMSVVLSGLSVGFVHYFTSYSVLLLSAFIFGLFSAVFYFLRRIVVCEIVTEDYVIPAYYVSIWICGFGYIIGIPVSAWLKDEYDTYMWSFVMAAVCFGVSGLLVFPLLFVRKLKKARSKN